MRVYINVPFWIRVPDHVPEGEVDEITVDNVPVWIPFADMYAAAELAITVARDTGREPPDAAPKTGPGWARSPVPFEVEPGGSSLPPRSAGSVLFWDTLKGLAWVRLADVHTAAAAALAELETEAFGAAAADVAHQVDELGEVGHG